MALTDQILTALASTTGPLLALKGMLLLGAALLTERALRRRSAALRHGVWTAVFTALLLLPAMAWVAPSWHVPLLPMTASSLAPASGAVPDPPVTAIERAPLHRGTASVEADRAGTLLSDSPTTAGSTDWPRLIGVAWILGVLLLGVRLLLSIGVATAVCRRAEAISDPAWQSAADSAAKRLGFTGDLRLARSERIRMPMTWGLRRHTVLLPEQAEGWSPQRREVVLLHEIAHAARADCAAQLISGAAVALHWFNPLAWTARRRQISSRELACDDAVLQAGASPADYARHLLEIARTAGPEPRLAPAGVAMARRSQLEGRLLAALEPHRDRRRLSGHASLGVAAAVLLVAVPLGTLTPWAAGSAEAAAQEAQIVAAAEPGTSPGVAAQESSGRARILETMIGILENDASADMRDQAAQALGRMEDAAAVDALARAVSQDASPSVRSHAAWALGMIESPDGVAALMSALADDSAEVAAQAAWALGMIESPEGVTGLAAALQSHDSAEVRSQAAWALGMIEDEGGLEALIDALEDERESVRKQALWAIGMIVG